MTPERHEQVSRAFLEARAMDAAERGAFLDRLAAEDADLAEQVRRLLESDEPEGATPLDRPLFRPFEPMPESAPMELGEVRSARAVYRPVRVLGEGGASTVYLANQTAPVRRTVAIKILRRSAGRREAIARFEAERQAVALMSHPAIAALYDTGVTADGRPFFVMEAVDGEPITDWTRRAAPPLHERLRLFLSLCGAVVHAHQKGVVHRDLKPGNILVTHHPGGGAAVKVIDFGVAKSLGSARLHDRSFATAHGQLVGTLAYMSPEQLAGDVRQIDVRTDVYALGAVLQEMLTGRPAIDLKGLDLPEAIRRVEACRRAPLRAAGRALPGDLDLVIAKAMAPEPARRYSGVPELAADVDRFLASRPVLARGPGAIYTARKFVARHRAASAALAAVCLCLAAAGAWVTTAHRRAERYYQTSKQTAEFLLTEVVLPLSDQIGSSEVRRSILMRLLDQTEEFAARDPDNPDVQTARAIVLGALGDIEEQEQKHADARLHNEEALRIRRTLAERFPEDPARLADLSIALVRVGDMFKGDDWRRALPYYHEALRIDEELAAAYPHVATYLSNLAWSYERVGNRTLWCGDLEAAERYFRLQRDIIQRTEVRGDEPSDVERCMVTAEVWLSKIATERGEFDAAIAHAAEARRWARRAVVAEPGGRLAALALSSACRHLASALLAAGRAAESFEPLEEAFAVGTELVRADPRDIASVSVLRAVQPLAGSACDLLGDADGAAAWKARIDRVFSEAASTSVSSR